MKAETQRPSIKLMMGATGVVFGDIGTSPLYAFRERFIGHHGLALDRFHVFGVLSMLVWALVLVVTVKYVFVTMRADNRGEGGSFALLALVERVVRTSPALPYIGAAALPATALFYGDAVITPAISILSAVEGLTLLDGGLSAWVIPVTVAIIVLLFAVQRFGTGPIGGMFGPVMVVWFAAIGPLGAVQVTKYPAVLAALNSSYALEFLYADPLRAFFTLGTVVLAVTGAEALYADMGHFGRRAIARAWLWLALPALLFCYAGQSALVLADPAAIQSPFYLLAPSGALIPLLLLSRRCSLATCRACGFNTPPMKSVGRSTHRPSTPCCCDGDRPCPRLPEFRRTRGRLRIGRHRDHGADDAHNRLRHIPNLALEPALGGADLWRAPVARSRALCGIGDEVHRWRLAAGRYRRRAGRDLHDLAPGPHTAQSATRLRDDSRRYLPKDNNEGAPRPRDGRLSYVGQGRCAACPIA
jgi:hypothetical protein